MSKGKVLGYIRVSSFGQNTERQGPVAKIILGCDWVIF